MRCGLILPSGASPLQFDPVGPVLSTEILVAWPGQSIPIRSSAVVDTGCPVDLVASTELAGLMRRSLRPARMESLDWGGRIETDVYEVDLRLGDWRRVEVHAPREPFDETLLGLRALLRTNLCIRGEDTSAYWVGLPAPGDPWDFITRDVDDEEAARPKARPTPAARRKRARGG